jgi:hypothetical protein
MERIKWIMAWIFFLTGALMLVLIPLVVREVLDGLVPAPPGTAIPAFTVSALRTLVHVEAICYGMLAAALLGAVLAMWRARSRDAARYWITLLAALENYLVAYLLLLALLGLVVLPRLANTPQPARITAAAPLSGPAS